jgi:hypothetical protein
LVTEQFSKAPSKWLYLPQIPEAKPDNEGKKKEKISGTVTFSPKIEAERMRRYEIQ